MRKLLAFLLILLFCEQAFAQNRTVKGRITDAQGKAVEFATIAVKGQTSSGVSADINGNFSVQVAANSTLVFSAAGFQQQEVNIADRTTVDVVMNAAGTLTEVVVTALGIKKADRALGYSVSKVDPTTLIQKSEPDILKSLQGKVAGVDIRTSQGTPGAATRIQIRGNSSFFGDNQPLIVVDGIPYSNDQVTTSNQVIGGAAYSTGFADLDPNDIATINILKGSSAAALYGSRASNGVVVITTKSGNAGRSKKGTEVTVSSSYSIEKIANLPEFQNKYGAGVQFAYSNANGSWGPAFGSIDSIPAWPSYRAAYPELFPSPNMAYRPVPNNVKDLFRTGQVIENSIGFNGGDEKNSVSLTASQLTHKGYVENSSYSRSSIGMGGSTKLSIGLNLRGNFSYSRSHQEGGFFGENQVDFGSQFARSLFLARNWDFTNLPFETKTGGNLIPNAGYDNPRWSAKYNRALTDEERFVAGVHADINLAKWINLSYNLGNNVDLLNRREIVEIGSTTSSAEGVGRIVLDNYRKQEIESNLLFTLNREVRKDLNIKLVLGNNINQRTTTRQAYTGKKFITPGVYTLSNTSQQNFGVDFYQNGNFINGDVYERRRLIGVFGDATVSYKNYAFLEVTGRNDWSSTLPVDHRSYFYPSVAGSFVFTDAFGMNSSILDFGKVRAGWAKVGRDAAPYSLEDTYTLGSNYLGQSTASLSTITFDPNLKPEFTQELEVGTQLSFLKRRIDLDLALYRRISTNLIAPISVPSASGYSQFYTNYGKISNKGIEIDLSGVPVRTKDFNWTIRAAFTKNVSTVEELTEGVDRLLLYPVLAGATNIAPYLEPGKPFGYLRGDKVYRDSATGAVLINPATGGMIVNLTDQQMIGDPNPDFKLGVTNTLTYKGFFVSALWDMTKGGDLFSTTVQSLLGRGVTNDTKDRETSWVIPGIYGDPQTGQPILVGGKPVPNQTRITTNDLFFSPNTGNGATFAINTASEWSVYDATVYRLRELSIGYDFPKTMFGKLPIGSATITLTGRNLWYLAPNFPKFTHFDPEVNSFGATTTQGIELAAAPTSKRYGVNLKVTF
jgi:TonB-linked SusC/RagA family outer membrane protein